MDFCDFFLVTLLPRDIITFTSLPGLGMVKEKENKVEKKR